LHVSQNVSPHGSEIPEITLNSTGIRWKIQDL